MTILIENVEEPCHSDPEDYVDDISDDELLADELKKRPVISENYDNTIVIDNVPKVGNDKFPKLKSILVKIFGGCGKIISEYYPRDDKNILKGYIFLEYENSSNAQEAVSTFNNYKLDKNHTFHVNLVPDISRCLQSNDSEFTSEVQTYKDPGDLYYWILDPQARDMYAVMNKSDTGNHVVICQHSYTQPIMCMERPNWTDYALTWSPRGTYFTTFHEKGVVVWGNPQFNRIQRFMHRGADYADFSPCEKYIVTFRTRRPRDASETPYDIMMWDTVMGTEKRGFLCDKVQSWPVFKWSHDGKFFARLGDDCISVYETPSFFLLDRESLKAPGVKDFEWAPDNNILILWIPPTDILPSKVSIIELPSRKELCTKAFFFVETIKIYWHKQGDYCCVRSDLKGKKGLSHYLNIFRLRSKGGIPVDVVAVEDCIHHFAWEPTGNRFVILHGDMVRSKATFYKVEENGGVKKLGCLTDKQASHISWSPKGRYLILAVLKSTTLSGGSLEFVDADEMSILNTGEHFGVTDIEWDQTGRFVVSYNNYVKSKMDNSYIIWTFQGRKLQTNRVDGLLQFLWRPRPPALLKPSDIANIKKNFKDFQKKFDLQDKMSQSKTSKELLEKRRDLAKAFQEFMRMQKETYMNTKSERILQRGGVDSEKLDDSKYCFENIEYFVNEEVIELKRGEE